MATRHRSAAPSAPPLLRVTGPADLAQADPVPAGLPPVPQPRAWSGCAAERVVVTARIDLDDLLDTPVLRRDARVRCVRSGAEKVVAVVFDDEVDAARRRRRPLPWCELADEVHVTAGRQRARRRRGRAWSAAVGCGPTTVRRPARAARRRGDRSRPTARRSPRRRRTPGWSRCPTGADLVAQLARRVDPADAARRCATRCRRRDGPTASSTRPREARDRADARALLDAARSFDAAGETQRAGRCAARSLRRRAAPHPGARRGLDGARRRPPRRPRRCGGGSPTSLPAPYDAAPLFLFGWAS